LFDQLRPPLAILDAEMAGISGSELTAKIKAVAPATRVVLVVGKRLSGEQMRRLGSSGCDEVLVAPMSADELYDVVTIELGLPRRGAERYRLELIAGGAAVDASVSNLSMDGARVLSRVPLTEGAAVAVRIALETDGTSLEIPARIVWAQQAPGKTVAGVGFTELDESARRMLSRLTQWEIVHDTQRTRVVLKGDFTEATRFDDLAPEMVGRIDFDVAQVTYMNSLGVRAWCEFLRAAPIQGYEFHACSVPFVLQASMVAGRRRSRHRHLVLRAVPLRLVRPPGGAAPAVGGGPGRRDGAPTFACPKCDGLLALDDLPERYFAFLQPDG
jgi:CheY-like chemotaxis protein